MDCRHFFGCAGTAVCGSRIVIRIYKSLAASAADTFKAACSCNSVNTSLICLRAGKAALAMCIF